ncbi:protein Niban 1a [Neosynchiropus ocellatus]
MTSSNFQECPTGLAAKAAHLVPRGCHGNRSRGADLLRPDVSARVGGRGLLLLLGCRGSYLPSSLPVDPPAPAAWASPRPVSWTKPSPASSEAEAELKAFAPYYRKQFSASRFAEREDELERRQEKTTQLLQQKGSPEAGEVLYEEGVLYFDDTRKWRERYVVVRANYCLECHESLETFVKGVPALHKLLPTGGAVLTTEEKYMEMVDKCFPDDSNLKEDFAPPLAGMPGQFPVYLRLPYRRDSYFCFRQQLKQENFLAILSDCIRHQNQDFLKKKTCEVQAFLRAVQLYRQDRDQYPSWDMLIGSDVRVLANLVMEQLLPTLEKDMLPRLKAKKTERKRVWFATVEAAYILIQEHLLEGLSALKEECRSSSRQQEVLIHSDMDQILQCRRQVEEKVRAGVSEAAERFCSESVQPYLGSVLEELMEPVSSGFQEGRRLSEELMAGICRDVQQGGDNEQVKKALAHMARPNLLGCYQKIGSLRERLQPLKGRFDFCNISGVIHGAQIDLQQLMENAAFTFEQMLVKAVQDHPDHVSPVIEKAKLRVLKQYDYDSSSVRKRNFQDAVVSITLPFIKKHLDATYRPELQELQKLVDPDYSELVLVENVYEDVLLHTLDQEVTRVVKEAASSKKYDLHTDSRDLLSRSSRSSLSASAPADAPVAPPSAFADSVPSGVETAAGELLVQIPDDVIAPPPAPEPEEKVLRAQETVTVTVEVNAPVRPAEATVQVPEEVPVVGEEPSPEESGEGAEVVALSGGEAPEDPEAPAVSDPNSVDVSLGSESPPSDLGSLEDADDPAPDPLLEDGAEAGAPPAAGGEAAPPADSVKEIRDLVVEVIEVEEPVQRYPSGVPMEE